MGAPETPPEGSVFATSDLGTAAYAFLRGLQLLGARRIEGERFSFRFADPEGRGERLRVDFINSESFRFDESMRALKKLCYDRPDPRPRRR